MDQSHSIWTIWKDQPDHPRKIVIRRYEIPLTEDRRPSFEATADDLDGARALLPPGLSMARRNDREDPKLIEVWMIYPPTA